MYARSNFVGVSASACIAKISPRSSGCRRRRPKQMNVCPAAQRLQPPNLTLVSSLCSRNRADDATIVVPAVTSLTGCYIIVLRKLRCSLCQRRTRHERPLQCDFHQSTRTCNQAVHQRGVRQSGATRRSPRPQTGYTSKSVILTCKRG